MSYVDRMLADEEVVMRRTRRHWVVLLRSTAGSLVLVALAGAAAWWIGPERWDGRPVGLWAAGALAAVGLVRGLAAWLRWSREVYLVTDRRVIQVEGVVHKRALDSSLAKVNDLRLSQTLAGRLLGYGTLEIITASESGINRLDDLPHPMAFKKAMMAAAEAFTIRRASPPPSRPRPPSPEPPPDRPERSLPDRLADLAELHRRGLVDDEEYGRKRAEILSEI